MNENNEKYYEYDIDGIKIRIKLFHRYDQTIGKEMYMAKSDYKKIFAADEDEDMAVKKCLDEISFRRKKQDKNTKLLSPQEALLIAQKKFNKFYIEKNSKNILLQNMHYSTTVECGKLIVHIMHSNYNSSLSFEELQEVYPSLIATVIVDLVTYDCNIVEADNVIW